MKTDSIPQSCCVIGGGIIGLWTALHLIREGTPTVLIEQFPINHSRGSSHGGSRSFRMLGSDHLTTLAYSLSQWQDLEKGIPGSLFIQTGLINFGEEGDPYLSSSMDNVMRGGYHTKWMSAEEISKQFPMLHYSQNWGAAYDETAGILVASKCVDYVRNEFYKLGGKLIHAIAKQVKSFQGEHANVQIQYPTGIEKTLTFKKIVACCGPWTIKLFPHLKSILTTKLIPVTYWQELNNLGNPVDNIAETVYSVASGFPIIYNARLTDVYAIPSYEYPGLVKVLYHGGPVADPDFWGKEDLQSYIQHVRKYVKMHFPKLDHTFPAVTERCFYTCTTDNLPILDKIDESLILGAGFSGSGFKHSPATGRILAALALGNEDKLPNGYQLSQYTLKRFTHSDG